MIFKPDVSQQLGAVTRSVNDCERDGKPARAVVASRTYDTTPVDLWDALTNAERLPRWFLPISGELRVGGRYQLQGNAGGVVERCEPPSLLAVTWELGGQVSWLEVRLREAGEEKTLLELTHTAVVDDALWNQFGPGAVGVGWDLGIMGLDAHITSGAAVNPEEALAWPTTPEGRAFVRGCSDDWARASIAAGTPADAARSAADRTTAFYTGDPDSAGAGAQEGASG